MFSTLLLAAYLSLSQIGIIWILTFTPLLLLSAIAGWRSRGSSIRNDDHIFRRYINIVLRFLHGGSEILKQSVPKALGYDIFISYKSGDEPYGSGGIPISLQETLLHLGYTSFLDIDEILPGDPLEERIQAALAKSRCLVLLLTEGVAQSDWMKREKELLFNANPSVIILPVFLSEKAQDLLRSNNEWAFLFAMDRERHQITITNATPIEMRVQSIVLAVTKALEGQRSRRLAIHVGKVVAIVIAALVIAATVTGILYSERADRARREAVGGLALANLSLGNISDAVSLAAEADDQFFTSSLEPPLLEAIGQIIHPVATVHLDAGVTAYGVYGITSVIATNDGRVHQFDLNDGHLSEIARFSNHGIVTSLDGRSIGSGWLALGFQNGTVALGKWLSDNSPHRASVRWIFVHGTPSGLDAINYYSGFTSIDDLGLVSRWVCDKKKITCRSVEQTQLPSVPTSADVSYFGERIVVGDIGGGVTLLAQDGDRWNVLTQSIDKAPIVQVAFGGDPRGPQEKVFAVSRDGAVMIEQIINFASHKPQPNLIQEGQIMRAAFDLVAGKWFVLSANSGSILFYNANNTQAPLKFGHAHAAVKDVVADPNNDMVLISYNDGSIRKWRPGEIDAPLYRASTRDIAAIGIDRYSATESILSIDSDGTARSWGPIRLEKTSLQSLNMAHGWRMSNQICSVARELLPAPPLRCEKGLYGCKAGDPIYFENIDKKDPHFSYLCYRRELTSLLLPFAGSSEKRTSILSLNRKHKD